jgi:hypothetical protein
VTTPNDARVRTLVDVDLTTVLDLDGVDLRFRPRTDWRTFDGQPHRAASSSSDSTVDARWDTDG